MDIESLDKLINETSANWKEKNKYHNIMDEILSYLLNLYCKEKNLILLDSSNLLYSLKLELLNKLQTTYYVHNKNVTISDIAEDIYTISKIIRKNNLTIFRAKMKNEFTETFNNDLNNLLDCKEHFKTNICNILHNYWYKSLKIQGISMKNIPIFFKDIIISIYFLKTYSNYFVDPRLIEAINSLTIKKCSYHQYEDLKNSFSVLRGTTLHLANVIEDPNLITYNAIGIKIYESVIFKNNHKNSVLKGYSLYPLIKNQLENPTQEQKTLTAPINNLTKNLLSKHSNKIYSHSTESIKYLMTYVEDYKAFVLSWYKTFYDTKSIHCTTNILSMFENYITDSTKPFHTYFISLFIGFIECSKLDNAYAFHAFWLTWLGSLKSNNYFNTLEQLLLNIETFNNTFENFVDETYNIINVWSKKEYLPLNPIYIVKIVNHIDVNDDSYKSGYISGEEQTLLNLMRYSEEELIMYLNKVNDSDKNIKKFILLALKAKKANHKDFHNYYNMENHKAIINHDKISIIFNETLLENYLFSLCNHSF